MMRMQKKRSAIFEKNLVKHEDLARSVINEGLVQISFCSWFNGSARGGKRSIHFFIAIYYLLSK
jgi:hypothetical protein